MRSVLTSGACLTVLVLGMGCASSVSPRLASPTPQTRDAPPAVVPVTPTATWPVRKGLETPEAPISPGDFEWVVLAPPVIPPLLAPVPAVVPQSPPPLPLPDVRPLPVKSTPQSRSWSVFTQSKVVSLPAPTVAIPKVVKADPPEEKKPQGEEKPLAVVPAKPQPTPVPKATPPPTAAAVATLLPKEEPQAGDFHWQDVNAVAGEAVTLHFDKTNWLYLDPPAQQKVLGFQSINRDKDATTFVFKPLTPGQYTLEFQRQDLVNQSTDLRKVKLTVASPGTRTVASSPLAPQTSTEASRTALEASRTLSAAGKTAEAIQKLLQSYRADDARTNLELGRLLAQTGQEDEAQSYLEKNLTLTGPDIEGSLELGTKLAATRDSPKKLPAYLKIWLEGTSAPSEDLYIQVFQTLRTQKLSSWIKPWVARYQSWYPAPKLRDRYLFQLGQWLEEPGDTRDVRGAWKAYNEVVQAYPLSPHWKAAGERAAYLNRHFLQAR